MASSTMVVPGPEEGGNHEGQRRVREQKNDHHGGEQEDQQMVAPEKEAQSHNRHDRVHIKPMPLQAVVARR